MTTAPARPRRIGGRPDRGRTAAALVVRMTPAELSEIHARAARLGLTASEWVRRLALAPPEPSPPT